MGLENSLLNRGVSLLEGFILTDIKALVTESTVLIRGGVLLRRVSANRGFTVYERQILQKSFHIPDYDFLNLWPSNMKIQDVI